jgi:23S rRNA pseudouridine955/2504/2580 synthase
MDHSKSKRHVYIVDDEQNGRRLDRVIRAQQGNVPQALIEKWARSKSLLVNCQPSKPNQRLNMGDEVSWPDVTEVIKLRSRENRKQNLSHQEIDIVFRAKSFLVLNKPSGLASQGGSGLNYSVDDWLTSLDGHWKLVHRLDRATSGCLLVARGANNNQCGESKVLTTFYCLCHTINMDQTVNELRVPFFIITFLRHQSILY